MDTRPPFDQLILTVTPAGVAAWMDGARVRQGVK
jgi:hypothetical protein